MLHFLQDELLEYVGSFVQDRADEITAVIQSSNNEEYPPKVDGKMMVLRTLAVCKYKKPCLNVLLPTFRVRIYYDRTRNEDGSYSFFDQWGNHLTLYTWSSRLEYFPATRCPIEDKEVPINYYYYDIFVEARDDDDLPRSVSGTLSKTAEHVTIRFDDASTLALSKYAVLLWDRTRTRSIHSDPSYYAAYNDVVHMRREIAQMRGSIAFFRKLNFLHGSMLPKEIHEPQRVSKRLIRYIRLSKSITIPVRLFADDIALVIGSFAE